MRRHRAGTVLVLALAWGGCGWFFRAPKPVATIRYPSVEAPARELLVLLPGRGDHARSFFEAGIIDVIKRTAPQVDVIAVDATLGYYIHRTLPERLHDDVIAPARGYDAIWLAGISMGGLGSALYAAKHSKEVAGVVLVAPFLGEDPIIGEIEDAGGLQAWQPPRTIDPEDYQRELWRWLKTCTAKPKTCPRILLGFGSNDRFVRAHRLLAAAMPPGDVVEVPGAHEWEPWRNLFAALLPKLQRP
jgi:pimeloyl-ACP methyl ester carboxylesterase